MRMTISTGKPMSINKNPERPAANNVTPWGRKRLNPSQAPTDGSLRDSTFMSVSLRSRAKKVSIESENLADLTRYLVDFVGLVLLHVKHLLTLDEFVSVSSRHVRRSVTCILLPYRLN